MAAREEIDFLAAYILTEVDGEPSRSEGAGHTAVRIIRALKAENGQLREQVERGQ